MILVKKVAEVSLGRPPTIAWLSRIGQLYPFWCEPLPGTTAIDRRLRNKTICL